MKPLRQQKAIAPSKIFIRPLQTCGTGNKFFVNVQLLESLEIKTF